MTDEGPDPGPADEPAHTGHDERLPDKDVDVDRTGSGSEDDESTGGRIPIDLDRRGESTARSDGIVGRADDGPDVEGDEGDDDRHRPEPRSTPIEPGSPSIEHAVFVALGALAMIAVVLRMVTSVTV